MPYVYLREDLNYEIPATALALGSRVTATLYYYEYVYNAPSHPAYGALAVSGTYDRIDMNGQVVSHDQITGVSSAFGADHLFSYDTPYVDQYGISFTISSIADSNDGLGNVNFFYGPDARGGQGYQERGLNNNDAQNVYFNNAGLGNNVACFAAGTLIRTSAGDVAIERLRIGDTIVTSSGQGRRIRWLGHRKLDYRRFSPSLDEMPVRIAAHAFGDNRPARDLLVSPGHAICINVLSEVLIPACLLVNGATIEHIAVDEITYWHVELDSQDIILAENLPTESYLDVGNRTFFQEADVVELSAGPDAAPVQRADAGYCRPLHQGGPVVEAVRAQLRYRLESEGWTMTTVLDLHLEVDGRRIDPVVRDLSICFRIPAGAKVAWLISPATRPCDTVGSNDRRILGLYVAALLIEDDLAVLREIAIDEPALRDGFHEVEEGRRRWTSGRACLPSELWKDCQGGFYLHVSLATEVVPRWTHPRQQVSRTAARCRARPT